MKTHDGTLITPETYEQLLLKKISLTQTEFSAFYQNKIDVYRSDYKHYRMRAEFRIWHDGDKSNYAMYKKGEYIKPVIIDDFFVGSKLICSLMPPLLEAISSNELLRRKLFQVEFLTTTSGEALITLIYHKPINEEWQSEALELQSKLGHSIIGRSRKQKIILDKDYVTEIFDLELGKFSYTQMETGFTQPNAAVCKNMLNWAVSQSCSFGGDLLELYCGNGNFTIPLSLNFKHVLATEVSKLSTRSALENIKLNKRENIKLIRLSAEEVSQAFSGLREFRRLADIDLSNYAFSTIFVDPPRAGLDEHTIELVNTFQNIIYISCNPKTLHENLEILTRTHTVEKMALFDQFPYTDHRECGVILKRKNNAKH